MRKYVYFTGALGALSILAIMLAEGMMSGTQSPDLRIWNASWIVAVLNLALGLALLFMSAASSDRAYTDEQKLSAARGLPYGAIAITVAIAIFPLGLGWALALAVALLTGFTTLTVWMNRKVNDGIACFPAFLALLAPVVGLLLMHFLLATERSLVDAVIAVALMTGVGHLLAPRYLPNDLEPIPARFTGVPQRRW